jgi:nucleoside-diphosphate-sugar epimerase
VTYRRFAEVLCGFAGSKLPRHTVNPAKLAWLGRVNEWAAAVTGLKPHLASKALKYLGDKYLYFDISKASRELGYSVRPLEETMDECARWFLLEHERVLDGQVVHPVELWVDPSADEEDPAPAPAGSVQAE